MAKMASPKTALVVAAIVVLSIQTVATHYKAKTEEEIAAKMLEDIGVRRRPDLKHANISTEEYALMYRVYQKSVRQTEANRDLQDVLKSSPILASAEVSVKPSVNVGRQRRSGYKAYTGNKGSHAIKLHFSREELLGTNAYLASNPNALHIVTSASLSLGLASNEVGNNRKYSRRNRNRKHHAGSSKHVTFTLYQLMAEAELRPEAAIVMDRQSVNMTSKIEAVEFELAETIQSWLLNDLDNNHGLRIECDHCHKYGIAIPADLVDLSVKIHTTNNQAAMTRRSSVLDPIVDESAGSKSCDAQRGKRKPKCCRESMPVDLGSIPGFEFIQQPRVFDAYMCRGRCPPRYNAANDHSLLQSLMHLKTRGQENKLNRIPRPCCAAAKMRPLDILHIDDNDPTKLKVTHWKNVVVAECACT